MVVLHVFTIPFVFCLFTNHLRLIAINLTTNEAINAALQAVLGGWRVFRWKPDAVQESLPQSFLQGQRGKELYRLLVDPQSR